MTTTIRISHTRLTRPLAPAETLSNQVASRKAAKNTRGGTKHMKVMYNLQGVARKSLVTAAAGVVGVRPEYMGTPTYSYRVGGFEINRDGTLIAPMGMGVDDFEQVLAQLYAKGFRYDAREDAAQDTEQVGAQDDFPDVPTDDATRFEITMPLAGFTESQLDLLKRLIASKETLIKKALGTQTLEVVRDEGAGKLTFPWFDRPLDSSEIKTYSHFIAALCNAAQTHKRVHGHDKPVESERFAFRIFLNRLGFAGREYADERKLLYRNLSGNCAFPSSDKLDAHTSRWTDIRKQRRGQASKSSSDGVTP